MKVNIVIPFFKNYDTIENLLRSIYDQDYKNYDITIVQDGEDIESEVTLLKLKESYEFNYLANQENQGAAYSRNRGAKTTDGEILFFIDADCELMPGMLRECVTQLELNPKISFVYGNYRFENKFEFYSQPFDSYLLETMNYISTMSPVRRKHFESIKGFIEDQKYFQDWSLFYRLSLAGHEGKYINEFIFSTKMPDNDSISGIQGSLAEKAACFRKNHDIRDKKICVTTFSAPLQAVQRAKMLDADYLGPINGSKTQKFPVNMSFQSWKGIYLVGVFNEPLTALGNHLEYTNVFGENGTYREDIKKIFHFIGTDVYQLLTEHNMLTLKAIKKMFEVQNIKLFANSGRMVRELKECGVEAELLYSPIYKIDRFKATKKLPKEFTVGVYYSDTNQMHSLNPDNPKSNGRLILDIAASMPHIKFKFFGGVAKTVKDNIEYCGQISEEKMVEFINSCSIILRPTLHDGFPHLPIQFMCCGRQAIVSVPDVEYAFAEKLSFEAINDPIGKTVGYEEAKEEVINKIKACQDKQYNFVALADQIKKYYSGLMSEAVYKQRIYQCLEG